jgi:phage baseplate assembly protein gpV
LNHKAVEGWSTDNITVNYKDSDGASHADTVAYMTKDVQPLTDRVNSLEQLGSFLGSFLDLTVAPSNVEYFAGTITINDFIHILDDADHDDNITQYVITAIDEDGTITYTFDHVIDSNTVSSVNGNVGAVNLTASDIPMDNDDITFTVADKIGEYLPLTGGTLTGSLTANSPIIFPEGPIPTENSTPTVNGVIKDGSTQLQFLQIYNDGTPRHELYINANRHTVSTERFATSTGTNIFNSGSNSFEGGPFTINSASASINAPTSVFSTLYVTGNTVLQSQSETPSLLIGKNTTPATNTSLTVNGSQTINGNLTVTGTITPSGVGYPDYSAQSTLTISSNVNIPVAEDGWIQPFQSASNTNYSSVAINGKAVYGCFNSTYSHSQFGPLLPVRKDDILLFSSALFTTVYFYPVRGAVIAPGGDGN